jgi:hypothetical protein
MSPGLLFEYCFGAIAGVGLGILAIAFVAACVGFFD